MKEADRFKKNKTKTKLVENLSESTLPEGSSGEHVSVSILTFNQLRGAPKLMSAARSNTSLAQRGSLISPRKILGKKAGMIQPPAAAPMDIHP